MNEAMAAYHVQSKLLQRQNGKFLVARGLLTRNTPRHFWRAYYTALSQLVKDGLVYYSSPLDREHGMLAYKGLLDDDEFAVARRQQRNELRRIEQSYETILMEETKFPKASQVNEEMKTWVELAFSNWLTLCGSSWTEAELGAGGKLLVGRDTLDVGPKLYAKQRLPSIFELMYLKDSVSSTNQDFSFNTDLAASHHSPHICRRLRSSYEGLRSLHRNTDERKGSSEKVWLGGS